MKNLAYYLLFSFLMIPALAPGQSIPAITSFSPSSGPAGTAVSITGTNFSSTPAENTVYFGVAKATVNSASASQLDVSVPTGATHLPITVTVNGLTAYSNSSFIVTFPFSGSIGASFASRTDFFAGSGTRSAAVSDLDGDGKTDVVAVDQVGNVVFIFRNISTPGSISWDSFAPKVDYATGLGPYAVATGDLDGDGKPDLVVTNADGASISVYRNTSTPGTISFSSSVEFEVVAYPDFIAIKDLDLDGKPDIAVASSNNFAEGFVSILRNTSTVGSISSDSFAPRVDFPAAHGGIWCVRLDDVDGDGKGDMTVTNGGDALVSIFRNISTPGSITSASFETKVDLTLGAPGAAYPGLVSLADLDGDQKPDLVVGWGNTVSLFRNISSPGIINAASFDSRVDLPVNDGPWNPAPGDVDGDGKLDLIVRDASHGTLLILKNISSPGTLSAASFSSPTIVETGGNSLSIFVGDMDGDGKADLTLSNEWTNVISVYRNADIFEPSPGEGIPAITTFSPTSGPAGTAVTITGTNFSATSADNAVFFGATKAIVNLATESQLDVSVPIGATFQPITVSPRNGLTAYSPSPFIVTFPFTGSIGASFATRTDFWAGAQARWETVQDLDSDGKPDVVVTDEASNVVSVLRNVSTPGSISWDSFQPKVDFATGPGPYAVATGDLDGDGKPDLVVTNSGGTSISIFRNTSTSGTISFSSGIEFEAVAGPVFVAIQDLDLDGKPDIAVTSTNFFGEGMVSIFRNTSTVGSISSGSFAPRVDFIAGHGGVWCVVLGDVDGDGKPDMTVTSGGDALVSIFRNISSPGSITSGSFEAKVDFATGAYPAIAFLADLDGDHKPDLAVGNAAGNTISIFRNISSPGFISSASFDARVDLASNGPWNPTAGDLNGDGKLDLIVRVDGTLSIFKNNSSPGTISVDSFSPPYNVDTGGNPLGISIGDMDGDGKADLTLSNEGTNVISVFRNSDIFEPSGPSNLTFSDITHTSLTAHFLASPDLPDGYIAIRRLGSPPNPPVNGTTYSIGQTIGEDVVAYIGSAPTFNDSSLAPGVEYYYSVYAYNGTGATIEYITSKWAANVAFTIGIDMGPIVTTSPPEFTMDDQITLTFDATKSFPVNALVGSTSVFMYSAVITEGPESGNWNLNYVNFSSMTSLGDNKWSITFIPRYFYNNVPTDLTVYRLAMVFFDEMGHRGVSFDGRDIYLAVLPSPPPSPPLALPATFVSNTGFEAEWNSVFGIYEYHLDVSTSDTFASFVSGYEDKVIYAYNTGTIRSTVGGLLPKTKYYYRVRAAGIPGNSLTILVTTLANPFVSSSNVWVKQFGGPGTDEIQTLTSDDKGNIYAAGHFEGTITIGSETLTSKGEFDIFFARFDPKGKVVWARSIGGPALDNEVSLATDSKGLYMTAQFAGDIDVDPGAGTTLFTNEGQWYVNDGFFARYDLSDGSLEWAHNLVDAATWSGSSIGVDKTGVYMAGHYSGAVDFDPGRGVALRTSQGADDVFLAKYSLKGKYLWASSMGGYNWDSAFGLLVNATGVYINGSYSWGSDFDPTTNYYFLDNYGGFFGRYDLASGHLIYIKNVGNGLIWSLDNNGRDLYISGESYGSYDADPDAGIQMIGTDGFGGGIIGKYNLLDGSYRWAKSLVTTGFIGPRKILADGSGAYVNGYFSWSVDFDGGPQSAYRTTPGFDAFVAHYNAHGGLDWAKGIGNPGFAGSITATLTDDAYYMGGRFDFTVNFDPYNGNVTRTSDSGSADIFIARYRLTKKVKKDHNEHDLFTSNEERRTTNLFPNPADDALRIDWHGFNGDEPIDVQILDLFGRPLIHRTMSAEENAIDVSDLSSGYHIFQARQDDVVQILRFIKK